MNVSVYLKSYNDVDHITPLLHHFIKNGDNFVELRFVSNFNYYNDYRIKSLMDSPFIRIKQYSKRRVFFNNLVKKVLINKYSKFLFSSSIFIKCLFYFHHIVRNNVKICIYQWGGPSQDISFEIAKKLNIKVICLPHGQDIFTNYDVTKSIRKNWNEKKLWPGFKNRNDYDLYIVQTQNSKKWVEEWGMDSKKVEVWGSLRFYENWASRNLQMCEKFTPKKNLASNLKKIVFFLPHWDYNVDIKKSLSLIESLSQIDDIYLVVKAHTRGDSLSEKDQKKLESLSNIELNSPSDSPALIEWSDIVINFGSSIGIEAVLQDKLLINPSYLHSNNTVFDDYNFIYNVNSETEIVDLLAEINITKKINYNLEKELFLRNEIYGGKNKYNVLEYYKNKIIKLGNDNE